MSKISIRFSGFGGQGIVLASIIMAKGAVLHEGKSAVQTQSYGPESRGGASKSDVIVSDKEIDYPLVEKPDILIALSQEALDKYIRDTQDDGLVIIDPVFIKELPKIDGVKVTEIPAATLADEIGNRLAANIVVLGALVALRPIISEASLEKAVKDNTPSASHTSNLSGMLAGLEYAKTSVSSV
jgi:2-oxoglutarate ferredoxin oxidoreductase subunit gamma